MIRTLGITGASGHLGGVIVRSCLEQDIQVKALVREDTRALEGLDVELVHGDLLEEAPEGERALDRLARGCDCVVHSAAIISISGDPDGRVFHNNTEGVREVASACVRAGVPRMVHISSVHAVQELLERPVFDETNPLKTENSPAYDLSKARGEQIFREFLADGRLHGCILRPSSIVGPWDFKPSRLGQAILDLFRGHIPVLPPGGYNFVDVRDVAAAVVAAAKNCGAGERCDGEVLQLAGYYHNLEELAALVHSCGGAKPPRFRLSDKAMYTLLPLVKLWARISRMEQPYTKEMIHALMTGHPNMSFAKAAEYLGFQSRPMHDTITDLIHWQEARRVL